MRAVSNSEFLRLWERGEGLHPLDQSLLALGVALPETPFHALADWTLGRRNRALAELYRASFRENLRGWLSCAACGEKLEFELDLLSLARAEEPHRHESIVVLGQTFRLPSVRDLARASQEPNGELAAIRLIEGCRIEAD